MAMPADGGALFSCGHEMQEEQQQQQIQIITNF